MKPRFEDNETLKRALYLAASGAYRTARDVVQKLVEEKRPRVNELLLEDDFMRIRVDDAGMKNWRPFRR